MPGQVMDVSCAVIMRGEEALALRRVPGGPRGGLWEFPGGKVEEGEDPVLSLHRELAEELGVGVSIRHRLPVVRHDYPDLSIRLHPFVCELGDGALCLRDHTELRWGRPRDLRGLDWAAADLPVLAAIEAWAGLSC